MSCLPWNSTSPEAKITDIPQAATGVGEADAKHRQTKKGGRKKQMLCLSISDARRASFFCFAAVVVVPETSF